MTDFQEWTFGSESYRIRERVLVSPGVASKINGFFKGQQLSRVVGVDTKNTLIVISRHEAIQIRNEGRSLPCLMLVLHERDFCHIDVRFPWVFLVDADVRDLTFQHNSQRYPTCVARIGSCQNLWLYAYVISNVHYRMGRWYSTPTPALNEYQVVESLHPLDLTGSTRSAASTRYKRAGDLIDRLNSLKLRAGVAFKDNVYVRNERFFSDGLKRAIFSFNRHVRNCDDYILWPLLTHQKLGARSFKLYNVAPEEKERKMFWRGSPTGCINTEWGGALHFKTAIDRYQSIDSTVLGVILQNYPRFRFVYKNFRLDCADIGFISDIPGFPEFTKPSVNTDDANKYLFQVALDGNDWPSSLPWQLANGNVVLMAEQTFQSIFTYNLIPWYHYVPMRSDFELIAKLLEEINAQTDLLMKMSWHGSEYMKPFMHDDLQQCIEALVLFRYAKVNGWEAPSIDLTVSA